MNKHAWAAITLRQGSLIGVGDHCLPEPVPLPDFARPASAEALVGMSFQDADRLSAEIYFSAVDERAILTWLIDMYVLGRDVPGYMVRKSVLRTEFNIDLWTLRVEAKTAKSETVEQTWLARVPYRQGLYSEMGEAERLYDEILFVEGSPAHASRWVILTVTFSPSDCQPALVDAMQ